MVFLSVLKILRKVKQPKLSRQASSTMGQRKSTLSKGSYDVAPIVGDNEIIYERGTAVPNIAAREIPDIVVSAESGSTDIVSEAQADNFDPRLVPNWVNEESFIDILKSQFKDFEQITSFIAKPIRKPTENSLTLLLQVKIVVMMKDKSTKILCFMLKLAHDNEQMQQSPKLVNVLAAETSMYFDILPKFEEMFRAIGRNVCFSPKTYQFEKHAESPVVLMDDLHENGFEHFKHSGCFDMKHTECVLLKLAQFHAASVCYVESQGPFPDRLKNASALGADKQFSTGGTDFLNNLKNVKDGENYYEPLKAMWKYLDVEQGHLKTLTDSNAINVLNHGKCWSNNILFRYDAGENIAEARFVDFQQPIWGSPANDLYNFLITSVNIDIKLKYFEYFVRYYHEHLIEQLKALNFNGKLPTLRELHIDMLSHGSVAITTAVTILPVVLLDTKGQAGLENYGGTTAVGLDYRRLTLSNERYCQYIAELLPWMHQRGIFQVPFESNTTDILEISTNLADYVPAWVNASYFADILRTNFDDFTAVRKIKVSPGTKAGENYSSLLLQVDIDMELEAGTSRNLSYMLKIPPIDAEAKWYMEHFHTFKKEAVVLNEIIPGLEQIYKAAGIEVTFAPHSINLTTRAATECILLENLRSLGFQNADRLEGLDITHTKAVLNKLAQFHAASAYLLETKGACADLLLKGVMCEEFRELFTSMSQQYSERLIDCAKTYADSEEYIENMKTFISTFVDAFIKVNEFKTDQFNVLNHGDCWTNNVMFQYDDEGKIQSTYLLNFQLSQYGTPAQDLYHFLLSSTSLDIKLQNFDEFVSYYHENLREYLQLLKYPKKIPTLKELHCELFKNGEWAFMTVTSVMATALQPPSDDAVLDLYFGQEKASENKISELFTNERYRKHAEPLLIWLSRRGLLDSSIISLPTEKSVTKVKVASDTIPSWIDEDHFIDILLEAVPDFSKLLKITATPAAMAGDNYSSIILRVTADSELKDGTTKQYSFMLKVAPSSQETQALMTLLNAFPKELAMYQEHLPEFEKLYKSIHLDVAFGPRGYKFKKYPGCETILMEDLRLRGFKNADRLEGLDMEHTKCVLKKMAQWHAASVKYVEAKGCFAEYFMNAFYSENCREMTEGMTKITTPLIKECIKEYENSAEYIDKVIPLLNNLLDKATVLQKPDPNEFNVLNHGDLWSNNIMFQHDQAGKVTETLFVDFQMCLYGSPAIDLYYFLMSSTQLDIKVEQFDNLIAYYHEQLVHHMSLLKCTKQAPTLKELHSILKKYGALGFAAIVGVATICLLEPSEQANLDTFFSDTPESLSFRRHIYTNKRYRAHAMLILPWLKQRGYLDV